MAFIRVNLSLDESQYQRLRVAVDRIPGLSVSEVVRDCIAESIPFVETLADTIESGDLNAARAAVERHVGSAFVRMALGDLGEGDEDT